MKSVFNSDCCISSALKKGSLNYWMSEHTAYIGDLTDTDRDTPCPFLSAIENIGPDKESKCSL